MARSTLADDLLELPWWILLILAAAVYLVLKFWLPNIEFQNLFAQGLTRVAPTIAWYFSGILVFFAGISALKAWRRGDLLEKQTGENSVKRLSWRDFEFLVGEAYKRKGYTVRENGSNGPDGGVDLVLFKDGEKTLVQCKHWQSTKIGVPVVRELLGAMTAKGASKGIVACSSDFTQPAINFARQNRIELITGRALSKLIASVQTRQSPTPLTLADAVTTMEPIPEIQDNVCPVCGSGMVPRVAKRGKQVGNNFWGCSTFPKCRGTRN